MNKLKIILAILVLGLSIVILILVNKGEKASEKAMIENVLKFGRMCEKRGYVEGQFDAMDGKINVKLVNDSTIILRGDTLKYSK